jgi:DNA replication and repair protein RecF
VLLDEAAAHLDASRRAALFDETLAVGLQVFMTGADRNLFDALQGRAQFIAVGDGELRPET